MALNSGGSTTGTARFRARPSCMPPGHSARDQARRGAGYSERSAKVVVRFTGLRALAQRDDVRFCQARAGIPPPTTIVSELAHRMTYIRKRRDILEIRQRVVVSDAVLVIHLLAWFALANEGAHHQDSAARVALLAGDAQHDGTVPIAVEAHEELAGSMIAMLRDASNTPRVGNFVVDRARDTFPFHSEDTTTATFGVPWL